MKELYSSIYKRRSVRNYDADVKLSDEELAEAEAYLGELKPLVPELKVQFEIVPREQTNCRFNAQYCLLVYGEQGNLWLTNIGYMLEQWDLFLASRNIGVCWFGMGKPEQKERDGLSYAIMLCFGKAKEQDFRTKAEDFNRNDVENIWSGLGDEKLGEIVRLAPSAVNSQPWRVEQVGKSFNVYRQKGSVPILSAQLFKRFNKIDMGIFLCYLDIALEECGYNFTRQLGTESDEGKRVLVATYTLD